MVENTNKIDPEHGKGESNGDGGGQNVDNEFQETNFSEIEEKESEFEISWKNISENEKRFNIGYYISFPFVTSWLFIKKHAAVCLIIAKVDF